MLSSPDSARHGRSLRLPGVCRPCSRESAVSVTRLVAVVAVTAIATLAPAIAAAANTPPNPYSATGSSWVDVPVGQRVYLENFGSDFDDYSIYSVAAGVTCTYNGITATGPFLTARELSDAECVDAGSAPYDPIDTSTRLGSTAFGFPINFFGTTYTTAYPNTNGGISFDNPDTNYDQTLASLASDSQSSAMYPLGADLYYAQAESNLWVGQTTIDGSAAVVFSWEKFHNCCNSGATAEDMSFQLVIIDAGGGDFNAWFNYESFVSFDQGYNAPVVLVDLRSGVTVGSNILVAKDVTNVPTATCIEIDSEELGTATDSGFISDADDGYLTVVDAAARTVAVWSDDLCTVPVNVSLLQDEGTDLVAYVQLEDDATSYSAISVGWSTYRSTGAIDATELFFNVDASLLADGLPGQLITRTLNTTQGGRFVIGQRGGGTVTDPSALGITPAAPTLAATGVDVGPLIAVSGALLAAGGLIIVVRRRRSA